MAIRVMASDAFMHLHVT